MWPKYWSFSFSIVLPVNIQGWFPLGLTGLISLLSKGLSRVFSSTTIRSHQFSAQSFFIVQLLQPYMTTGKAMTIWIFVGKMISLLFNMLSRFVIVFVPRSKHLLISWLQSLFAVILEPKKINSVTASTFPHLFAMKWWDWMPWSWPSPALHPAAYPHWVLPKCMEKCIVLRFM